MADVWDERIGRAGGSARSLATELQAYNAAENARMLALEIEPVSNGYHNGHANGHNGNGHHQEEEADAPRVRPRPAFICPEEACIGPWRAVADALGYWDSRVWIGTTAAISARAGRDVNASYHGPFYGMGYWLLIAPSSSGKRLVTLLFERLVTPGFRTRSSVESGQALVHVVADIVRNEKHRIVDIQPHPAALLLSEWHIMLLACDFAGSSLMPRLNQVYDGEATLELTRSDKQGTGNLIVHNPTLTLVGTTTESDYQRCVKERHIQSGLINRHFILPGPHIHWLYDSPHQYVDYSALNAIQATLPSQSAWGQGRAISELYEPEAREYDAAWGQEFFGPLHNPEGRYTEADLAIFRRLHVHNRRIQALAAWSMGSPLITLEHVAAAHAMVRLSYEYLSYLTESRPVEMTATANMSFEVENKIINRVKAEPGIIKQELVHRLRKNGGYNLVSLTVEKLLLSGALVLRKDGQKKRLYPSDQL